MPRWHILYSLLCAGMPIYMPVYSQVWVVFYFILFYASVFSKVHHKLNYIFSTVPINNQVISILFLNLFILCCLDPLFYSVVPGTIGVVLVYSTIILIRMDSNKFTIIIVLFLYLFSSFTMLGLPLAFSLGVNSFFRNSSTPTYFNPIPFKTYTSSEDLVIL